MQLITLRSMLLPSRTAVARWVVNGFTSALMLAICFAFNAQAAPGELDTNFSFDGLVTTGFGVGSADSAFALAIQSDGKIVATGRSIAGGSNDFALARYNTDGSLDAGFGSGGIVLTDFGGGGSSEIPFALAIQSDGKMIAAGFSDADGSNDLALARYDTDGSLDAGFGSGGIVLTDFGGGSADSSRAVVIQSDGKIVAAGRSDTDGSEDLSLARYNTDGSLDVGFGSGGIVLTDFGGGSFDRAFALAIQSDGKLVASGISDADGSEDFALARYNTDGSLDVGFGSGGMVLTDFGGGSTDSSRAVIIQTDGKIVAAGISDADGSDDIALARYNTDGSLDAGFGSGGVVLTDFGGGSFDSAQALAIQTDGKLVASGISQADGSDDFVLSRYNTDGSLDAGFGIGGILLTDFSGGSSDSASALAIQSDGKIVAAGESDAGGNFDFALARYLDSIPGVQPGDANGDGLINILDVTAILNDILGISPAPGNGDCNEDLMVNILDVTCVLNIILGG